jgi:hypothetical protein
MRGSMQQCYLTGRLQSRMLLIIVIDGFAVHLWGKDKGDESLAQHKHPPKRPDRAPSKPECQSARVSVTQSKMIRIVMARCLGGGLMCTTSKTLMQQR